MIKYLEKENLNDLIGNEITLVDFYADWCGPCKMLGQVLEGLNDLNIIKVNVDEEEELARKYKVMSIPNMLIIKDGEIKKQLVGFRSLDDLKEELDSVK